MKMFADKIINALKSRTLLAKLISLLLAVLLWAFISHTRTGAVTVNIPLEIRSIPPSMMVTAVSDRIVVVTLEGPRKNIRNTDIKRVKAYVEVKDPEPGELKKYRVRLMRDSVHDEIQVRLARKYVNIMVDRKIEKRVPVFPVIAGSASADAIVGRVTVKPDIITVTGPEKELRGIDRVLTETLHINGEKQSIDRQTRLLHDKTGNLSFSETNVNVSIPIYIRALLREISVPVEVRGTDERFIYTPSVKDVKVYIRKDGITGISRRDLKAFITPDAAVLDKILSGSGGRPVTREFPVTVVQTDKSVYIDIISIVPDRLELRIEKVLKAE